MMHSDEQIKKIIILVGRQIRGELNAADERDLKLWISENKENEILFDQLTDPIYRQAELMEMSVFTSASSAFANFMEKYGDREPVVDEQYIPQQSEFFKTERSEFLKYILLMAVLLMLSFGFFLYLSNNGMWENSVESNSITSSDDIPLIRNSSLPLEKSIQVKQLDFFAFNGETLESVMQKIGHWYDFNVSYADKSLSKQPYIGSVSKSGSLSLLLGKLEDTMPVKFRIEGREIVVHSKSNKYSLSEMP